MTSSSGHFKSHTAMNPAQSTSPRYPRLAVGAVVFRDRRVLLVLRGHPPAKGQWAIPGGKVKLGETLQQAAEREILEETGIRIKAGDPIFTFETIEHDPKGAIVFHYVIIDLSAEFLNGTVRPGDDALDVRWFAFQELPITNLSPETLKLLSKIDWR